MPSQDIAERQRGEAVFQAAVKEFDVAVRHFQKQKYDKAREIFENLSSSPAREVASRARIHLQLCERRLRATGRAGAPKTAEDFYHQGILELNGRALEKAVENLSKADKLAPNREHIRYALAAAHALQGNSVIALEHLSAAIELRPENRIQARRDEDFHSLADEPRFKQLLNS